MTSDKTWYLGPLGDLRPLVCPSTGISIKEERYGGVHQGLSGARTLDITGHRATYELELANLDVDEFAWVESLYTGNVPGPYRLINPLKKNRLSHQASTLQTHGGALGLSTSGGTFLGRSTDWPSAVPITGRSMRVSGGVNASFSFDAGRKSTLFGPGESFVGSVYVKADAQTDIGILLTFYDRNGENADPWIVNYQGTELAANTEWKLFLFDFEAQPTSYSVVLGISMLQAGTLNIAAPQLEAGTAATSWEIGGGAPEVVFDQMPTVSHRYPLRTASLTLLET